MTAIVVLGLHCGGTSAVAGVLHHLGVFMGRNLLGPGYNNPRGHFEDGEFVLLHNEMIEDWTRPTEKRFELLPEYGRLIEKRAAHHTLWGVKDPRMVWCFTQFMHYINQIDELVKVFEVLRKPSVAAQSLFFRGGHTPFEALDITYRYHDQKMALRSAWVGNESVLNWMCVSYEDLVEAPCLVIEYMRDVLLQGEPGKIWKDWRGIPDSAVRAAARFIDPELCHWREA